jgi:isoprenylcysteine carboxyl methyltransferase (ICMT) family protein YpbQ
MSAIAYGLLRKRQAISARGATAPDSSRLMEMVAALVPADVLAAHALLVDAVTTTQNAATSTPSRVGLQVAFFGLAAVTIVEYVLARLGEAWHVKDYLGMAVPPCAFVLWTMLQRPTAFDAVAPGVDVTIRLAVAVIGALMLLALTRALAKEA